MRIIMVSDQYPPIIGGTERQAEKLSREMSKRGHDVIVITGRWSRELPALSAESGIEIHRVNTWNTMWGIRGLRKFSRDIFAINLRKVLMKIGPGADVFHVHFVRRAAAVALDVGRHLQIPVLVKETSSGENNSFHTLPRTFRGPWLRRLFLRELRHIVVLNEQAAREYSAEPFRHLTIHRAFNGISLDETIPVWMPEVSRPTILYLGRIRAVKGAMDLLEAFDLIEKQRPEWKLRFCGGGEGLEELRQRAMILEAGERVEITGPTKEPLLELSRASLLVLPSVAEGMSNTLLEAMAVGVPAVATDVGANAEMLEGGCGWVVGNLDPQSLAAALLEATGTPQERARRGRCARERVRERYTLSRAAERYEEIYQSLSSTDHWMGQGETGPEIVHRSQ